MNWLTKWSFNNKTPLLLLVILTLILGTISYFQLPKEFLPSADNPMITVIVIGDGADAETMNEQVTKPIEKAIASVTGKTSVFSTSSDGYTRVDILVDPEEDIKTITNEVKDKLNLLNLPEGFSPPIVSQLNTDMIPLWQLGVTFSDGVTREAMEKVEQEIIPQFQGIKGINNVSVYGKSDTSIIVKPDQKKLDELGIPVQALLPALQKQSISAAVGEKNIDSEAVNIKVVGRVDGIEALKETEVVPQVKLKDVAKISVSNENEEMITRINGKEAVALLMFKEASVNAVSTGDKVDQTIEKINTEMGPEIQISTIVSFSDFIVSSSNDMMQAVLLGALFATFVVFLFLRHLRMTLITIVSIPLSLGLTLLLLQWSGVTLNILTLGAVAVAVGRLIDDSIVVVENIYRKVQEGKLTKEVIIGATKEVTTAITSSTLTTVAVFLPIGLVKSLQELLLPFALTITYSLLASLLVALTVVPLMSSNLLKGGKINPYRQPKMYKRLLTWCLNHKWVPLLLSFILFVGSLGIYATMPQGTTDAADNDISVSMRYPDNLPFEKVKEEALALETDLMKQPGVKDVLSMIGNSSEDAEFSGIQSKNSAVFYVTMKEGANSEKLMKWLEKQKETYPDSNLDAMVVSMMSSSNSTIEIDLVGKDASKLMEASSKVMDQVEGIEGVEKVSSNQEVLKPVYSIVVDPEKADAQEVMGQMRLLLNPVPMGNITLNGKETPVIFDSEIKLTSQKDLENVSVMQGEQLVPLSRIAKLEKKDQPTSILSKNGDEYVQIQIQVDPTRLSEVNQTIMIELNKIKLPKGVSLQTGGAAEDQAEQFAELFQVMAISVALVYLIMVITFKTLRAPLVILFTLPLAVVGAVLGLLVSGLPVDIGAMIGALMLIGIVVTNAIVLLDRVRQNEQSMSIREAILEASVTRLRPIVMTAISTIFAMVPLLFGKEELGSLVSTGMAVVVIGGLAVATLLTLVVIPVVYELFHFRKAKRQRLQMEANQSQSV